MGTLRSMGAKIGVATMIATGLAASAALAAMNGNTVDITLPESVSIGSTTLPGGQYRISEIPLAGAQSMFVFRDDKGETAAVVTASKNVSPTDVNSWGGSQKTEIVLSPGEDGTLYLNEMFVEGDSAGYRFLNLK